VNNLCNSSEQQSQILGSAKFSVWGDNEENLGREEVELAHVLDRNLKPIITPGRYVY
jgi:hypothetical protein